ncbi:MAG: mercury transporter MerT [Proteobacteria bacterium]|nr:mercury transporter MerT [Pseudomonadota bacterium]
MSIGVNPGLQDIAKIQDRKRSVAAAGGALGAVLASSCCLGPLVLITLGASGAWIGNLTALKAYQPVFVPVTLAFLGFGFWQVYGKSKRSCDDDAYCASPVSDRLIKTVLWVATVLIGLALSVDLWAPFFY